MTDKPSDVLRVAIDPVAWRWRATIPEDSEWQITSIPPIEWGTTLLIEWEPLYTGTQAFNIAKASEAEAMERAANMCDEHAADYSLGMYESMEYGARSCAAGIRALPITQTNTEGEQ